ncbi:MAG: hypothetical protein CBD27_07125 [Rhodospirillaceae bacterium TMED167]|nr:hypothetical protein [Rhodospirillaceae bacterium]OUW27095.1 MAG: hypothetical protein CBD27_07125 [Rhodospirillaceae bacterium TMED167]
MRLYTLHLPAIKPGRVLTDGCRLHRQMADMVPIKEGFCWPALFFSLFWSLWHRLWLVALGLIATNLAASVLVFQSGANQAVSIIISFGIASLLGFMGNDLRRAKLEWRGFRERGIVLARTAESAVRRYLMARTEAR